MTAVPSPTPNTPDLRKVALRAIAGVDWELRGARADKIVNAVLAAVLPGHRRQVAEDIAYDIRGELVCCDIYDQDADTDRAGTRHGICFWGEAGARIAEDHATGTPERLLLARLHVDPTAAARAREEQGTDG